MGMMNAVAVLGVIIMIVMYIPINRFLRDRKMFMEQSGAEMRSRNRKNKTKARVSVASPVTSQDRAIGLTIFVAAMIAAFIVRVVMGGIYHGHEYDMNCFIAWADMAYKDGLSNFYISEAFTDYPPGYIYILYVIGWLRDVFHIAWNSVTSDILTKMPAMLADLGTGYLIYRVASKKFRELGAAFLSMLYFYCCCLFSASTLCTYYCKYCFDSCCHNNAVNLCNTKTNIVCCNTKSPCYECSPVYSRNIITIK